jgi:hypothetical protein
VVRLWYGEGVQEDRNEVLGVGGDMVVKKRRDGGVIVDDEAFKKAFTDALTNAMKHLGMSADVHMGMFDDSKYVGELRREKQNGAHVEAPAPVANGNGKKPPFEVAKEAIERARTENHVAWIDSYILEHKSDMTALEVSKLNDLFAERTKQLKEMMRVRV